MLKLGNEEPVTKNESDKNSKEKLTTDEIENKHFVLEVQDGSAGTNTKLGGK